MNELNKFGLAALTFTTLVLPIDYYASCDIKFEKGIKEHKDIEKIIFNQEFTNTEAIIEENSNEITSNFHTIKEFVSKLVNNSKQIDQDFADAIDEGFWDLI